MNLFTRSQCIIVTNLYNYIFYQISGDMVIRSSDTDVLITLLGMVGEQRRNHEAVPYGRF